MNVPFLDLKAQYQSIKTEVNEAIQRVIEDCAFIKGKYVNNFAEDFRGIYGVKHFIPVANGTDAIYIVLKALGIGAGDEVITVANSWISTSETIRQIGAKPVFVDIEKNGFNIDSSLIESKITGNTKAIIPVHLFGHPADVETIQEICNKFGLFMIEDCAQAHFAEFNKKKVGTFGIAGTFSFYPGKNLGAYGDAGGIITEDTNFAEKCEMIANHGGLKKHHHAIDGINSRMDGMQASILSVKLKYINQWTDNRRKLARRYNELLKDTEIITPSELDNYKHVYHVYCVKSQNRNELKRYLHENGVASAIHYPTPLPLLPVYEDLSYSVDDFPIASSNQNKILSLPMFPEMTEHQQNKVVDVIKKFQTKD